jgi:glycosyltransferase involved in cell wall biosynthesis
MRDRTPRVSVVIPTKDRCERLATTLAMVLDQTVTPHEVLVVVDGSVDRTVEYLRSLGHPQVRALVNTNPSGVAAARNRGIAAATGDWVAFTDDDDLWTPRKLELQLDALARQPEARWSTVTSVSVDEDFHTILLREPPRSGWIAAPILEGNVVPGGGSGVLADLSLVREVGGFDTRLRVLADWDLWIRLALHAPQAAVPEPMVVYLVHDANMSLNTSGVLTELEVMRSTYADRLDARARRTFGVETLRWIARIEARNGDTGTARRLLVDEIRRTRFRRPGLIGHAWVTLAGPRGRRSLDAARARLDRRRGGMALLRTLGDMRWRADHAETGVAPYLEDAPPLELES